MIDVLIRIPDMRDGGLVCSPFVATVHASGYAVEAWCVGWGRNKDGSVRVDVAASVTSPPGLTAVLR